MYISLLRESIRFMFQYVLLTLPERKKKNVKKDKIFLMFRSNIRIHTYVHENIYNNPK